MADQLTRTHPLQAWRTAFDAGVYTNVAIHPAVPPGGALLRTSVMATHDSGSLDRALESFASVKAAFEAEHGAAAADEHADRTMRQQPL
mgnify:CR=1 FL=1